ncbi:hypothetical protein R1sor_019089 [Riccia sorocarpa]|uniref:Uncharacterized protein n=1 Tax=Riccia sorocarpa TaxID=122646 RepID=A0ABD3IFS7_9MARC
MESPPLSDGTPKAVDLSQFVFDVIIEERSLLAGREFQELSLALAGKRSRYIEKQDCLRGCTDPSTMVKILKAFVSHSSKHKLLRIDDVHQIFYFGDDCWDSVFSPLLYEQSSLEAISVECNDNIEILNAVFTKIPHLLANSSTLETLCFACSARGFFRLSDAGVKALSEGLVRTKCLRTLVLREWPSTTPFVDVLTSAFTGNAQNTSLEEIDLPANMERLGMAFEVLVSKYKNLNKIRLGLLIEGSRATSEPGYTVVGSRATSVPEYMVDNFEMVAECLHTRWQQTVFDTRREVLLDIYVSTEYSHLPVQEEQRLLICWDKWLSANDGALLLGRRLELSVHLPSACPMWIHEIVRRCSQLALTWNVGSNVHEGENDFFLLFRSIQSNDTLEFIDLDRKALVFRSLMDLVQVNIYLEEIVFGSDRSGSDGIKVLLQEALRRNQEQSAHFATLRDAKLPFEEARAARVFLCGHPHAGKSTLRITMMKSRHKESRIIKYWRRKLVDYFRAEYERALSLHGTTFHMDGWNEKEVGPFVDDLLVLVSEMLNGIVTKGTLDSILKKLSETYRKKKVTVDRQFLQDLLVNLDLCYPIGNVEGVEKYFMPTIFCRRNARREDLIWRTASSSESKWQYFGYRLRCVDANTTSIPAATFPRFQIWFRKEMVTDDETCILQRDVILLDHNLEGYSIIVENAEEGAHIDVLFQFSGQKKRAEAMEYVREHVLQEFRKFCASPQGCRGVTFETAIIRPECVLRLTRQEYRKDQHFWKGVPEAGLFKDSQQAIELLSERDVEEIMEPIRQRSRVVVEQLTKVEQQLDSHLQQSVDGEVSRPSAERYSWKSEGVSSGSTQEDKRFSELHKHFEYVKEHVEEHVDKAVASLSEQLQVIRKDIQQLQEQMHSTLLSIITKIDTMVGYSRAQEDARVPRVAFITFTDVRFRQRMKSAVQIGTPVRLHLMCESRFRPHGVYGQPGLELSIGAENREWIRHISVNALKIFWALLKAGVDSQLPGAGCFIPELGDLSSGLVPVDKMTLNELKKSKLSSLPKVEGSRVAEDVWKFLRRTLPPAKIPEDFKLQLVRYNPGTVAVDQSYAWLCQECLDEGEKNHVLKCVGF